MKSKSKTVEMCSGSLFLNILKFTFPFMLANVLQRLYNAADVVIVGRYAGREALAGVGTTGSVTQIMIDLFVGLAIGTSAALGRALGAGDKEKSGKIIHTSMMISILGGLIISVLGVVFAGPLLTLIEVPSDVMQQAKIYMQIIFSGQVFSLIYNFGSAVLRAKGDTKRPLYIVTISGIINVLLNLMFVVQFKMKAEGVALATVISQIFTAIAIIYILRNETDGLNLKIKKLSVHKESFLDVVKIGVPSGVQSMIFSFANIIIQSSVNSFGPAAIAGSAAAANIGGFYYIVLNSLTHASLVFVSRNMGAKKYDRIKKSVVVCLIYACIIWAIEALITILAGKTLVGIYAPGDNEAIKMGTIRVMVVGLTYGLCGCMGVMSGALRGIGRSMVSMIISIAGVCGIRILWVLTVFKSMRTFESLFVSFPLSWLGTFLMEVVLFIYFFKKLNSTENIQKRAV